jgi:hypothetical protein
MVTGGLCAGFAALLWHGASKSPLGTPEAPFGVRVKVM